MISIDPDITLIPIGTDHSPFVSIVLVYISDLSKVPSVLYCLIMIERLSLASPVPLMVMVHVLLHPVSDTAVA